MTFHMTKCITTVDVLPYFKQQLLFLNFNFSNINT